MRAVYGVLRPDRRTSQSPRFSPNGPAPLPVPPLSLPTPPFPIVPVRRWAKNKNKFMSTNRFPLPSLFRSCWWSSSPPCYYPSPSTPSFFPDLKLKQLGHFCSLCLVHIGLNPLSLYFPFLRASHRHFRRARHHRSTPLLPVALHIQNTATSFGEFSKTPRFPRSKRSLAIYSYIVT